MFLTEMFKASLLFEATDYRAMFGKLFRAAEGVVAPDVLSRLRNNTFDAIKQSKQRLRKDDRMVWFLRHYRNGLRATLKKQGLEAAATDQEVAQFDADGTMHLYSRPDVTLGNYAHFLSLPIAGIQNLVWLDQSIEGLSSQLKSLETEWQENARRVVTIEEGDEILLKFKDGFAWWLLDRHECRAEGKAMGHCGNTASGKYGQRILSLRRHIHGDNWSPVATFILNEDGSLGEMKGRNNEKPIQQYHPYIVALLKHNIISSIRGGGHAPEENFSLKDLDDETRENLLSKKPNLVGRVTRMLSVKPRNEEAIKDAVWDFLVDENIQPSELKIEDNSYVLREWETVADFVDDFDSQSIVTSLYKARNDIEEVMVDPEPGVVRDMLRYLPGDVIRRVSDALGLAYRNDRYFLDDVADALPSSALWDDVKTAFSGNAGDIKIRIEDRIKEYLKAGFRPSVYQVWVDLDETNVDSPVKLMISITDLTQMVQAEEGGIDADSEHDELWRIRSLKAQGYDPEDAWYMDEDKNTREHWQSEGLGEYDYAKQKFSDKVFGVADNLGYEGDDSLNSTRVAARNFADMLSGNADDADLAAARSAMAGSPRLVDSFRRRGRRV